MNRRKKIVLIDDDDDDWFLFREAAKKIDDTAIYHFFQDSIEAVRFLSGQHTDELPDYIFLDLNMPRMNGKECLIEIKKRKELVDIPVIILSTSDLGADILHAKLHGASYFVTKPDKLRVLEEALRFVLGGERHGLSAELSKWVKLL
jgi:CheY-like chemotaxis protein